MSVEDKINELVEKFSPYVYCYCGSGMLTNTEDPEIIKWNAKRCALVTVEEILNKTPMYKGELNPEWKFWNDVKKELETSLAL